MDGEMTPCVTPHNSVTQLSITSEKPFPNVPTGVKGELRRGFSIRREAAGGRHLLRVVYSTLCGAAGEVLVKSVLT